MLIGPSSREFGEGTQGRDLEAVTDTQAIDAAYRLAFYVLFRLLSYIPSEHLPKGG